MVDLEKISGVIGTKCGNCQQSQCECPQRQDDGSWQAFGKEIPVLEGIIEELKQDDKHIDKVDFLSKLLRKLERS